MLFRTSTCRGEVHGNGPFEVESRVLNLVSHDFDVEEGLLDGQLGLLEDRIQVQWINRRNWHLPASRSRKNGVDVHYDSSELLCCWLSPSGQSIGDFDRAFLVRCVLAGDVGAFLGSATRQTPEEAVSGSRVAALLRCRCHYLGKVNWGRLSRKDRLFLTFRLC